mmetsp:Transcript_5678/g.13381  ORF Transcript_5678/g.13381 Transcript_5678/m.13381 type:complete len:81 (-) Transcript_5678:1186-1428(-)
MNEKYHSSRYYSFIHSAPQHVFVVVVVGWGFLDPIQDLQSKQACRSRTSQIIIAEMIRLLSLNQLVMSLLRSLKGSITLQ